MGDLADDAIDGSACGVCGAVFTEEHGYPVLCVTCWDSSTPRERKGYQRATEQEV